MKKIFLVLIPTLVACGNMSTPFHKPTDKPVVPVPINPNPEDPQNPPDENPTEYCQKDTNGDFTNKVKASGGGSADTHYWGQGGGCLTAPIAQVWSVFQSPDVTAWEGIDGHDLLNKTTDAKTGKIHLSVKYWVDEVVFTVWWQMDWFHSVYAGTTDDPRTVLINYSKVDGTSHIPYWEGSIALEKVTSAVTSFTMRNQIHADRTGVNDAIGAVTDQYKHALKALKLQPATLEATDIGTRGGQFLYDSP